VKLLIAEQRAHLREHCSLEELETYRQGALPSDRREWVAEHLAACEDCAILLLCGVAGVDGAESRREPQAQEIEESWSRLRSRLGVRTPEGRPLVTLLGARSHLLEEALTLALEISRALASLHSSGRTHPNLRAENVLIMDAGEARLLERGFAPTPESLEIGYGRPAEPAVVELYRCLSPEQVAGEEADQRSNLFSLGVLLYEVLTGVSPFRAPTPLETASRIVSLEPAPASEINQAIPPEVSNLLGRLLAKEPGDRPSSAVMVVRDLESALDHHAHGGSSSQAGAASRDEEIERLYDEIAALVQERTVDGGPREEEIARSYARLRELQMAEAKEFRARFEAGLTMPIDAGEKLLKRARAVREALEDPASSDPAAREADDA
jgi:hypothetical protein